jgi:signal transduction histidine kinase
MRAIHPQCNFVFDVDGDTTGWWDPHRVSQVVANLLDNAVKHSGTPGGPVRLSVRGEPDVVVMVVQNRGTPVPAGVKLFDAFERGQRGGGLGLGLYIVDQIVRRHDGTISYESSEVEGTTFVLRWPRGRTVAS